MFKCILFNVASGTNGVGNGRSVGVYRIAHYLREHSWDVEVIDFATGWTLDELCALAKSRIDKDTKFIGFSHMYSVWSETLEAFAGWLKLAYPTVDLISGSGIAPQFKSVYLDYYIQGFGEHSLIELLQWLYSNGQRPRFSLAKANNKHLIASNEQYPAFPMSSLMVKYEDRDFIQQDEWLGIEFARGCKFACDFCNFPVLGVKGDYSRDQEDFRLQLMDAYDRFGVTNYYVSDETFNDRTEKITKFADVVETLSFKPYFTGFIRADLLVSRSADQEELLRMNFLGHFYGVETFYHTTGKAIGKGMNPYRLKEGIINNRKFFESHVGDKFRASVSLIAGLPHEPKESLYETIDWLEQHWQGQAFSMYPLEIPNSEFYYLSKISKDWVKYGYRDATNDPDIVEYVVNRQAMEFRDILLWKNECMSIREADEISKKAESLKNKYEYKQNNFGLIRTGLGTLEDRLKLLERSELPVPTAFIKSYITRKLGL